MTTTETQQMTEEQKERLQKAQERALIVSSEIQFAPTGGMTPRTFEQLVQVAKTISSSGYFRDANDFTKAIAKIQYGAELGIPIMAALNNIYIIEGKPSLSSGLISARIKSSGYVKYKVVEWDNEKCVIEWSRLYDAVSKVWEVEGRSSWTVDDTKQAGLSGRDNHKKYPKAMNFARALTQGARAYCAELFFGAIYDKEEIDDEIWSAKEVKAVEETKSGAEKLADVVVKEKKKKETSNELKGVSPVLDVAIKGDEQIKKEVEESKARKLEPLATVVELKPMQNIPAPKEVTAELTIALSEKETVPSQYAVEQLALKKPEVSSVSEKKNDVKELPESSKTLTPMDVFDESVKNTQQFIEALRTIPNVDAIEKPNEKMLKLSEHLRNYKEKLAPNEVEMLRALLKSKSMMLTDESKIWQIERTQIQQAIEAIAIAKVNGAVFNWFDKLEGTLNNAIKE
jgi:hypothetical protein